jgi:two-component system LytT family sensor kinase
VENTVDPEHEISTGAGGIGLKNVRRQLELLYPQQHELAVGRQNGQYLVRLEIDLSGRR